MLEVEKELEQPKGQQPASERRRKKCLLRQTTSLAPVELVELVELIVQQS